MNPPGMFPNPADLAVTIAAPKTYTMHVKPRGDVLREFQAKAATYGKSGDTIVGLQVLATDGTEYSFSEVDWIGCRENTPEDMENALTAAYDEGFRDGREG